MSPRQARISIRRAAAAAGPDDLADCLAGGPPPKISRGAAEPMPTPGPGAEWGWPLCFRITERFAVDHELSERETAVLASAVGGCSMKQTAVHLRISVKTVECYWARIYEKTSGRSQLEVLAKMLRRLATASGTGTGTHTGTGTRTGVLPDRDLP
jgi:DNA-binding NarL/FixJ family response regulator